MILKVGDYFKHYTNTKYYTIYKVIEFKKKCPYKGCEKRDEPTYICKVIWSNITNISRDRYIHEDEMNYEEIIIMSRDEVMAEMI